MSYPEGMVKSYQFWTKKHFRPENQPFSQEFKVELLMDCAGYTFRPRYWL